MKEDGEEWGLEGNIRNFILIHQEKKMQINSHLCCKPIGAEFLISMLYYNLEVLRLNCHNIKA